MSELESRGVSFILPTNRPPKEFSCTVIDSIRRGMAGSGRHYEVLVSSTYPFDSDLDWVYELNWVYLFEDTHEGPLPIFNRLAQQSRGKYIVCAVDDHRFDSNLYKVFDFLESEAFARRKYKICTIKSQGTCYLPHHHPFYLNPHWIVCRFPVLSKETLQELGGTIFHPRLNWHYGDIVLGWWLGMNGEPCLEYSETELHEFAKLTNNQNDHIEEGICVEIIKELEKKHE